MSNAAVKEKSVQYVGSGDEKYAALEDFCDAILQTEDGYAFKVHRIVLSRKSIYFQTLFLFGGPHKSGTEYLLKLFSGRILSQVLHYLYSGKVYLDADNIVEMLLASNYYLLDELDSKCQTFAKKHISLSNCLKIFIISHMTDRYELYRYSRGFICVNFNNILSLRANNIFDIPLEIFKNLLEDDSLNVPDERYIWRAVEKWVGISSERLSSVPELFSKIRFCNLNNHLLQYLQKSNILIRNPSMKELNNILLTTNLPDLCVQFGNFLSLKYPKTSFKRPRQPSRLYLIAEITDTEKKLYITYNEDFCIRRKLALDENIKLQPNLIAIVENLIYIFQYNSGNVIVFNLLDRTCKEITSCLFTNRFIFHKNDYIYVVGDDYSNLSDGGNLILVCVLQRYDLKNRTWEYLTATLNSVSAAMIGNKIYINIKSRFINIMIIEEYDIMSGTLSSIPTPPECSCPTEGIYFRKMVASDDELFVISYGEESLNIVEVFRPETGVWEKVQSLPTGFQNFDFRILDGKLVVFDKFKPKWSPVFWNKTTKVWTPFESKNFHLLKKHWFYPIEDYDTITCLMNENRSCEQKWEFLEEIF